MGGKLVPAFKKLPLLKNLSQSDLVQPSKNLSQTHSHRRVTTCKKAPSTQMALFAAIGDRFISKILKQVAHDYKLDYEEMKSRYLGAESFEKQRELQVLDLSEPAAPVKKARKPKAPSDQVPLSKMKKADLVAECEKLGLDPEGTIAQLKERVKEARLHPSSPAPEPSPSVPSVPLSKMKKGDLVAECERLGVDKEGTVSQLKERVKEARLKPVTRPVEDEEEEEEDDQANVETEDEAEEDQDSLQDRLRKILAEDLDE